MTQQSLSQLYPKYYKDVAHLSEVDVYQVHQLFGINDPSGCVQHASKKLLLAGQRTGGKATLDDIREARDTLNRYLQINSVAALLTAPRVQQAANDSKIPVELVLVPMEAKATELLRFVVLYYYEHDDRRFKPRQYFALSASAIEAVSQFQIMYPSGDALWVEQVNYFVPDGDRVSRNYWVHR